MSMVVLVSGVGGMVLCIGADGHVALEVEHAGHCAPAHAEEHDDHACADLELTASDCSGHACVDVDLGTEHAPLLVKVSKTLREQRSPLALLPAPQLCSGDIASWADRSRLHGWGSPRTSPSLDVCRTVVLRI
ncbi:MAG: hypothetical protein ISS31_04875 [Kiritimatiellae bacterium]|nr:hypothetical protein [Kiritimatiellia bacterium]